jgi:hypothetical protein
MKATFFVRGSTENSSVSYPVILVKEMQFTDGFTLVAYEGWEDANDDKALAAFTDIIWFHLDVNDETPMGF